MDDAIRGAKKISKVASSSDPFATLVAGGTLSFHTALSPEVKLKASDVFAPSKKESEPSKGADWYLRLIQPTIVLESPTLGRQTIAPGGVADPDAWKLYAALLGLGVLGVGALIFFAGRASKSLI